MFTNLAIEWGPHIVGEGSKAAPNHRPLAGSADTHKKKNITSVLAFSNLHTLSLGAAIFCFVYTAAIYFGCVPTNISQNQNKASIWRFPIHRGTPKSSILIGFSINYKRSSYWGNPHSRKPPYGGPIALATGHGAGYHHEGGPGKMAGGAGENGLSDPALRRDRVGTVRWKTMIRPLISRGVGNCPILGKIGHYQK